MDSIRGDFLSNVCVDISELIQSSQNIKCAISSIETTKMTITKKHQQLGCDWKDKKYRELLCRLIRKEAGQKNTLCNVSFVFTCKFKIVLRIL